MSAVYFGSYSVLASVPGIGAQISACSTALGNLNAVVNAQLAAVANAAAAINAQIGAIASAKISIRLPAIADFQVQLDAAAGITAGFTASLSNPSVYISGLLEGLAQAQVNITAVLPSVALNLQLEASLVLQAVFTAKIAAVDLQLSLLDTVNLALSVVVGAVLAIQSALSIAVSAALNVATSILGYINGLSAAGSAHAFLYDGPLSGLGAAIDLVTPSTGIAGGVNVHVPLVLAQTSNGVTVNAMNNVFRVSA